MAGPETKEAVIKKQALDDAKVDVAAQKKEDEEIEAESSITEKPEDGAGSAPSKEAEKKDKELSYAKELAKLKALGKKEQGIYLLDGLMSGDEARQNYAMALMQRIKFNPTGFTRAEQARVTHIQAIKRQKVHNDATIFWRNTVAKSITGVSYDEFKSEAYNPRASKTAMEAARAGDPHYIALVEDYDTKLQSINTGLNTAVAAMGDAISGFGGSKGQYGGPSAASQVMSATTQYASMSDQQRKNLNQSIMEKNVAIANTFHQNFVKTAQAYDKSFNDLEKEVMKQNNKRVELGIRAFEAKIGELKNVQDFAEKSLKTATTDMKNMSDLTTQTNIANAGLRTQANLANQRTSVANENGRIRAQQQFIKNQQALSQLEKEAKANRVALYKDDPAGVLSVVAATVSPADRRRFEGFLNVDVPQYMFDAVRNKAIGLGEQYANVFMDVGLENWAYEDDEKMGNVLGNLIRFGEHNVVVNPELLRTLKNGNPAQWRTDVAQFREKMPQYLVDAIKGRLSRVEGGNQNRAELLYTANEMDAVNSVYAQLKRSNHPNKDKIMADITTYKSGLSRIIGVPASRNIEANGAVIKYAVIQAASMINERARGNGGLFETLTRFIPGWKNDTDVADEIGSSTFDNIIR